jgi:hypothetical protein
MATGKAKFADSALEWLAFCLGGILTLAVLRMILREMKIVLFVVPVIVLLLAGGWIVGQVRELAMLELEKRGLKEKIDAAVKAGDGGLTAARKLIAEGRAVTDWKSLASELADLRGGAAGAAAVQVASRISGMSAEEMMAALEGIEQLGLTASARAALEATLAESLGETDPERVLRHFTGRLGGSSLELAGALSAVLKQWADRDLKAATAWLDRQIANGSLNGTSLDGRNDLWLRFEGAVIEPLLTVNLAEAGRRLGGMPEDFRREVLQQMSFGGLTEEARLGYAELVRAWVPEAERAGSFAQMAAELVVDGGFSEVSGFLNGVNASAAERAAAVRDAANLHLEQISQQQKVTAAEVDGMRAWLELEAPELRDRITGRALAETVQGLGQMGFEEASGLVLEYQARTGKDDVLAAFLEGFAARSNGEVAMHLVEKIRDAALRAELLEALR